MKLTHVRGFDTVRAVGVVMVLVYHLFTPYLPGGFFGVDVFFVISGFLVTALLMEEFAKTGRVDIIRFYVKRVQRLLPAAAFMVVLTLALALLVSPDLRVGMREQVAAVFGWVTNYYEISVGGSYEEQLLPSFFVHTWTLAIEMHYYIIWGAIVAIVCATLSITSGHHVRQRVGRLEASRPMGSEKLVLFMICFVFVYFSYERMQWGLAGLEDPSPVYFATVTRIYPLMIGSAVGLLTGMRVPKVRLPAPIAFPLFVIILGALVWMGRNFTFSDEATYHYGILVAALLAALLVYCVLSLQPTKFFKDIPPLAVIGKRSYSIYLFHWPLYNIFEQMAIEGLEPFAGMEHYEYAGWSIAATALVAELSYRAFERGRKPAPAAVKDAVVAEVGQAVVGGAAEPEGSALSHEAGPLAQDTGTGSQNSDYNDALAAVKGDSDPGRSVGKAGLAARRKGRRPARLVAVIFCICIALSGYTLATVPEKTSIEEEYLHQQVMANSFRMGQYNEFLANLQMNPVAHHGMTEHLPPKPSEIEDGMWLDAETDAMMTREAAMRALQRENPAGPITPISPPGGSEVTLIGDSVPLGAVEVLHETIGSIIVDAEVSRNMNAGAGLVTEYDERGELGEYVVLALFTNPINNMESATNNAMAAIPEGHRVIVVTPYGKAYMEETAEMVRRLPLWYDYVTVADWNAAIRDNRNLLASDNIHMGGRDSRQLYANLIAQAIEQAGMKPAKGEE
ncbi:MAG: acyltransferase [Clostridiales bacterium]|nr:acyltransferase [Clostridiales bacterium]